MLCDGLWLPSSRGDHIIDSSKGLHVSLVPKDIRWEGVLLTPHPSVELMVVPTVCHLFLFICDGFNEYGEVN